MPVFEIEANGQTFEIDAPDMNAAAAAFQNYKPQQPQGDTFAQRFQGEQPEQSMLPAAIADVPTEIRKAWFENLDAIKKGLLPSGQGERGAVENLLNTGRGLAAVPGLVFAPVTGAARSLVGHPMAAVEDYGRQLNNMPADPQGSYERAKSGVDLAMSAGRAPSPKAVKAPVPSVEQLKRAASDAYQSPEVKGLQLQPESIKNYADQARIALNDAGIDDILAPKTFGILSKLDKAPPGATISGDNINTLRKTLRNAAGSSDPTERLAASRAIEALDEFLPNISRRDVIAGDVDAAASTLAEARGNYAAAARSEAIDKKTIQAELRAAAANSGHNVANTIRQRMADILLKDRRGYSPEELAQMERIVRGTRTENAMRTAGNMMGGGGGLGSVVAAGVGGYATGGPGAAAPLVGFLLRAIGNRMTLKQAEKLSEAIRTRSPLASSMQKFEERAAALAAKPSGPAFAAASLAARNFATNLKDAGFAIAPSELLRGIQGPVPAGAETEQQ